MKTLDEFFEKAKAAAADRFNRVGEHIPMFMFDGLDGLIVMPAPWRDQREKEVAILATKSVAKAAGATRAIVITEGWMVTRPPGSSTEGLRPSKEPDRVEVIWIVGQSVSEGSRAGIFAIERVDGKAKVGGWTSYDEGHSSSIFDGIVGGGLLQ